jgi:hypothetical protein
MLYSRCNIQSNQSNGRFTVIQKTSYECRSQAKLLGWPLVHIAFGADPQTGRRRVAKGIIAVGDVAVEIVAVGGFALGGLTIAGLGLGVVALGGIVIGGAAAGAYAIGLHVALGGVAVAAKSAIGALDLSTFLK